MLLCTCRSLVGKFCQQILFWPMSSSRFIRWDQIIILYHVWGVDEGQEAQNGCTLFLCTSWFHVCNTFPGYFSQRQFLSTFYIHVGKPRSGWHRCRQGSSGSEEYPGQCSGDASAFLREGRSDTWSRNCWEPCTRKIAYLESFLIRKLIRDSADNQYILYSIILYFSRNCKVRIWGSVKMLSTKSGYVPERCLKALQIS